MKNCAYLDIETTGFNPFYSSLTVVGIHLENGNNHVIQLVGSKIYSSELLRLIEQVDVIYTYNGARFDLPYIKAKLHIDLKEYSTHKDLMYECWQRKLFGGLKNVERQLGIKRKLTDIDGCIAVQLWHDYKQTGNEESLETLLEYNREDVLNLKKLRERLRI
ncbi:MAG: ribonuclease H-like domain-containing protein [Nitrospirae bacterium]|nr:ribonuclease H-like domain-containing protein [Nitrospirota bacterium]